MPIQIHGLCHNQTHSAFLTTVVDRCLMQEMYSGKLPPNSELKDITDKFFKPTFTVADASDHESDDSGSSDAGDSPQR